MKPPLSYGFPMVSVSLPAAPLFFTADTTPHRAPTAKGSDLSDPAFPAAKSIAQGTPQVAGLKLGRVTYVLELLDLEISNSILYWLVVWNISYFPMYWE